ncbi:hypothetical protein Dimus_024728 [Dionaea muscipula]
MSLCFVLLLQYFQEKRKKALFEALEKIKGELMVLGFISLLLTFGQDCMSNICIPEELATTMLPSQRSMNLLSQHIMSLVLRTTNGISTGSFPLTVHLLAAKLEMMRRSFEE